ncbi:aromatic-ring-hydroxylating dioxygenase subunit beta [Luteococcus sp. Sow4_B9]|uniref:aromatic-ring-hydroxylating dioxygenase subunit beta n=1 Tax=Luteococcus sp. Sow4_B9 TaxID=3438792 RepID=UPI003F97A5DE
MSNNNPDKSQPNGMDAEELKVHMTTVRHTELDDALPELPATNRVQALLDAVDPELQRGIERFLYEEVQVLDDLEWGDWIDFFADDLIYWAPVQEERYARERRENRIKKFGTSVYFEENKVQLKQRVDRLLTNMAWGEEPPSRARHVISNIRVTKGTRDGEYVVKSNFYDYRSNGQRYHDSITGERTDIIVKDENSTWGFLIRERRILFDMAMILNKNLSLFY